MSLFSTSPASVPQARVCAAVPLRDGQLARNALISDIQHISVAIHTYQHVAILHGHMVTRYQAFSLPGTLTLWIVTGLHRSSFSVSMDACSKLLYTFAHSQHGALRRISSLDKASNFGHPSTVANFPL